MSKFAELKAAAAPQDPPAQDPPAQEPPAQEPPAPSAEESAEGEPEQSLEEACAELGIAPDNEGNVRVELLVSIAGEDTKAVGDEHVCSAAEAVRAVRAGIAKLRA